MSCTWETRQSTELQRHTRCSRDRVRAWHVCGGITQAAQASRAFTLRYYFILTQRDPYCWIRRPCSAAQDRRRSGRARAAADMRRTRRRSFARPGGCRDLAWAAGGSPDGRPSSFVRPPDAGAGAAKGYVLAWLRAWADRSQRRHGDGLCQRRLQSAGVSQRQRRQAGQAPRHAPPPHILDIHPGHAEPRYFGVCGVGRGSRACRGLRRAGRRAGSRAHACSPS